MLWKTTLIDAEFWAYNNYGTARVVYALTKKVLAEATLLTFKKVGQALEFATTVLRVSGAATTRSVVIDKSINGFLEHALFVALNNFWSVKVDKLLETVITVNNTAIKVIKVGSCKAATRQGNHRT